MPFPSRPLRLFLAALAIVGGVWGADAQTKRELTLFSGGQSALFGFDIVGPDGYNGLFPTTADWDYIKRKGIKTVQLKVGWENFQTTLGGPLTTAYVNNIKTALAAAAARGISVILCMQNYGQYADATVWGSTVTNAGNAGISAANVYLLGDGNLTSANFSNVWSQIATALVGLPGLGGYDIMNEPLDAIISTNMLLSPNAFAFTNSYWFSSGAVATELMAQTNPLGANYGPPWQLNGAQFSYYQQGVTIGSGAYSVSGACKTESGTGTLILGFATGNTTETCTTSWQRFCYTGTPGAGSSNPISIGLGFGTTQLDIANWQLESGSSCSTYQPSTWLPYAQAAITAIRAVDSKTLIYLEGQQFSTTYAWPFYNYELIQAIGGNIVFSGHAYFDGPQGVGDGGSYAGSYTSYSINTQSGVQVLANFATWLKTFSAKGQIGEFNVPNSSADNNAQWLPLQKNFLMALKQINIPANMIFYGANNAGIGATLYINPSNGVDDIRVQQMLSIAP